MKYINKNNGYSVSSYGWRGIIVLALALLVSFNFLLLGGGRAEAAGIPNDAQGVSTTGKYYADNNNQLMVVTNTEEHAIAENWAFCLANGKKFPEMHLVDGEAVYDGEFTRHLLKAVGNKGNHDGQEPQKDFGDDLTSFIEKNHKFGHFVPQPTVGNPTGESAAVLIAKLVYVFYADPTGILESSGLAKTSNARNDFWAVVQNEIWRWTDGANFKNDYRYYHRSQQWRNAFEAVQRVYAQVTIPDNFQLTGYYPDFVSGAGYQAILTGRTVNLQPGTVKITKHWKGVPQGETKPEVWMQLQKDGKAVETKQLEENGDNPVMEFTISDKTEIDKYTVVELKADKKTPWAHDGYSAGTVTKVKEGGKEKPGEFEVTNTKNSEQPQPGQPTKHKVKLSKKEVNKTEELPGATLKVIKGADPHGTEKILEWVSTTEPKEIELEPGIYTMIEIQAPQHYELAEEITFKVEENGSLKIKQDEQLWTVPALADTIVMRDAKKEENPQPPQPPQPEDPAKHKVVFSKQDIGGEELPGASITLKRIEGGQSTDVEAWVSDGKTKEFSLTPGSYQFVETAAPRGYKVSTAISFTVAADGKVTQGATEVTGSKIVMVDGYADQSVTLSKKEVNGTQELPGASLKLFKGEAPIGDPVKEWTSGTTAQTFSLQPGVYTMQEIQAPDGYEVAENVIFKVDHFGKVSIKGADDRFTEQNGTIVTMFDKKKPQTPDPDQPGGEDPAKPAKPANSSLKTTVSTNGSSASSSAALSMELDKAASATVVDKVDYEGLLVGEPYTLTGRLMRIDGDQAHEVAQAEKKFTPTAAAGTQTVTFSNVTIEPGATYVVFETATSDNEILFAGEDKPVKHTVTHEDKNDKAQTLIVTKKAPETPDPEKPGGEDPAKPAKPANSSLKTTVSTNGSSASSSAALSMELDKAASATVVDKVDYEGLLVGEPYTLTGRLMRIDGDQAHEVAQAEKKFTPTAAAGTQTVTFSNVTIEPGATYVVFETATSDNEILFAGEDKPVKHTVTHEDKNDKAQTLIVTKKAPETPDPEKPKPDQPGGNKPDNPAGSKGDESGKAKPADPQIGLDKRTDRTLSNTGVSLYWPALLTAGLMAMAGAALLSWRRKQR